MVTITNLRKDGTLSWLHLSDIHFGEAQGTGRDAVLNRLIDDVRGLRERDELAPDLIFITGDIAWSGKPDQYQRHALPFLEKLQAAANVEPSRIFLIPGNHDVDRSQIKSIALKKFQEELIVPPAGENDQKFVTEFLTSAKYQNDRKNLLLKHKAYIKFVTKHFPHCTPEIVPCAYTCPVEFPKGVLPFEKLWVVGLNTAWLGRDGEDKGKLLLGYEQIQQALNVIENHGSWSRDFILALTHHPLSWLPEWDERLCQQQIETRCDFHLSGHLHETHFNLRGVGGPQRCSEIAAGSAYGGSQWYNGYNLVELDFQTGKGRAYLRRFEPTIVAWKPDIRFERPQPGQFTWDLHERFPRPFIPASGTPSTPESSDSGVAPAKDLFGQYRALLADTIGKVRLFGDRNTHPLEKVFVELTIFEEYESPCVRAEWEGLMDLALRERRDWFRRDKNQDESEEKDAESSKTRVKARRTIKPDELLNAGKRVFVAGAPGSGKSTLLRYLANKAAQDGQRWPVFLELKALPDKASEPTSDGLAEFAFSYGIVPLIQSHLGLTSAEQTTLHAAFLESWKQGNVVLCLDGLDEIGGRPFFDPLRQLIESFAQVQGSKNVVIVSSRPFTFQPLAHLEAMEIAPLNDQQISAFLEHYQGEAVARKMNQEFGRHRDMRDLARSPFMLAVIANLFTNQELVISSKLELYRRIVFDFVAVLDAEKRVKRFHLDDPKGALKREFLQFVAFERFFEQEADGLSKRLVFTGDELVVLAKRFHPEVDPYHLAADVQATPLLREVGPDVFAFSHLTIQEYLAAVALAAHPNCEKLFCRTYFNPEFTDKLEILPMTLGLVSKPKTLYAALENLPESLTYINLRLRARGLAYVEMLPESTKSKLIEELIDVVIETPPETSLFKDVIFESFIGVKKEIENQILNSLIRLELSAPKGVLTKIIIALGYFGKSNFDCAAKFLFNAAKNKTEPEVIFEAAKSLQRLGIEYSQEIIAELMIAAEEEDWIIKSRAIKTLSKTLHDFTPDAKRIFLKAAKQDKSLVLLYAHEGLAKLGDANDQELIKTLIDYATQEKLIPIGWQSEQTLLILSRKKSELIIELLIKYLYNENLEIRSRVIGLLGRIAGRDDSMVIPHLVKALQDPEFKIVFQAKRALIEVSNKQLLGVIESVLNTLKNKNLDGRIRATAAEILGEIGSTKAAIVQGLRDALKEKDSVLRSQIAIAIGKLGNEIVKFFQSQLVAMLKDHLLFVRFGAAKALVNGGKGDLQGVISCLIDCLGDSTNRVEAIEYLGRAGISHSTVINALVPLLNHQNSDTRAATALALLKLGYQETNEIWDRIFEGLGLMTRGDIIPNAYQVILKKGKTDFTQISDHIIHHLVNSVSSKREKLLQLLAEIGEVTDQRVIDLVFQNLESSLSWEKNKAVEVIIQIGKVHFDLIESRLLEVFKKKNSGIKEQLIKILINIGEISNPIILSEAFKILTDKKLNVRMEAAGFFSEVNTNNLFFCCFNNLHSSESSLRRISATLVGYYTEDIQVLNELLRLSTTDPVEEVRQAAIEAQEKYLRKLTYFDKQELAFAMVEQSSQSLTLEVTREFIAHEVRSALGPIAGYAKMLEESLANELETNAIARKCLQQISKQIRIANQIVNEYVDYTRPLNPVLKPIQLNDVVEGVCHEILPDCERLDIHLSNSIAPNCEVTADAKMLGQVFRNVLRNAIEAIEQDKRTNIEKRLELAAAQDNGRLIVTIRDTGPGLTEEAAKHVFQLGFTTKLGKQGAGIGLALVQRLIKEGHRGNISIKNNHSGPGAVVTIELPAKKEVNSNGR